MTCQGVVIGVAEDRRAWLTFAPFNRAFIRARRPSSSAIHWLSKTKVFRLGEVLDCFGLGFFTHCINIPVDGSFGKL
jgi:hypothetical protein